MLSMLQLVKMKICCFYLQSVVQLLDVITMWIYVIHILTGCYSEVLNLNNRSFIKSRNSIKKTQANSSSLVSASETSPFPVLSHFLSLRWWFIRLDSGSVFASLAVFRSAAVVDLNEPHAVSPPSPWAELNAADVSVSFIHTDDPAFGI